MESSEIVDVNANGIMQELELIKNKVLAKSSFTRSVNKLIFDMEELDVSEIQEAYKKMESCFEAALKVMKSLSDFYIRKQDVEKWKVVVVQMGKVEEDFIMADQRTRKHLMLRKSSVSSGMNPMKMSNDHDTHETEDTILQRHAGVGNTEVNSKIQKSLPVSNIYMQPQPNNDSQYTILLNNDAQGHRSIHGDSDRRQIQGSMPTNEVNHCSETERKELQYRGVSLNLELTETRISQNVVQIKTGRQSHVPTGHSTNAINKTKQKRACSTETNDQQLVSASILKETVDSFTEGNTQEHHLTRFRLEENGQACIAFRNISFIQKFKESPLKITVLLYDINNTAYFNKEVASKIWSGQEDQNVKRALLESTCMRNPAKNGVTMSDLHFARNRSELQRILLNCTKYHKTDKIENQDISIDISRQFKFADIFEDAELYLQTEKILEERVCHTLLRRGTCRGRPPEVCAPKLVAAGVKGNRQQLVQASKWMIPDPEVEWAACVKMTTTMDTENQLNEKAKRTQWCTIWRSLTSSFANYMYIMRKFVSNFMRILLSFESVSRIGPRWTGYISCESGDEGVLSEL